MNAGWGDRDGPLPQNPSLSLNQKQDTDGFKAAPFLLTATARQPVSRHTPRGAAPEPIKWCFALRNSREPAQQGSSTHWGAAGPGPISGSCWGPRYTPQEPGRGVWGEEAQEGGQQLLRTAPVVLSTGAASALPTAQGKSCRQHEGRPWRPFPGERGEAGLLQGSLCSGSHTREDSLLGGSLPFSSQPVRPGTAPERRCLHISPALDQGNLK